MARGTNSAYDTNHKIVQRCTVRTEDQFDAAAALSPGHLLTFSSTLTVQKNNVTGQNCMALVACEDSMQGRTITTAYATGEKVRCQWVRSGDQVLLRAANGESITKGDKLQAFGAGENAGTVGVLDADSSSHDLDRFAKFVSLETLDFSDSSSADPSPNFILCQVM